MPKIELSLKQKLNLTTELITSIEIMQLNSLELQAFLQKESEDNVFIDYDSLFDDKSFRNYIKKSNYDTSYYYNQDNEDIDIQDYTSYQTTLKDFLLEQLGVLKLNDYEYFIGRLIINHIDDKGYFKPNIEDISKDFNINPKYILPILKKIQNFEPRGIAARTIEECLLLQVEKSDITLRNIIKYHLDDIYKNNLNKISKAQEISIEELNRCISKLKKLNPIPSSGYNTSNDTNIYIQPDIIVEMENENFEISLKENQYNLKINDYYLNMLDTINDEETKNYLKSKLSKTIFLIESIEKRKNTILKVSSEIIRYQEEFFLKNFPLKPMTLKDIANLTDLSESTISRVTKNKYIQINKKLYPLKHFFSSHINSSNDNVSKDFVMNKIKDTISNENPKKPLSDQKITDILNVLGIDIRRRTVSKYRDELNIQPAKNRKKY